MKGIPYGYHWLDEDDIAEVAQALRSEWITQGSRVSEFEEQVAHFCGARFGIAFSSGTAALHASCFAAGLGPGDEFLTTPLTFVATANAGLYQGARPVFADIDPDTLNMDPEQVRRRLTPKTKVILPVHFGGLPCAMEKIWELAEKNGARVIEDACHALGAEWIQNGQRRRVGSCSHSDMAVLSFHPVKHVTTGEGGMVLTNSEPLAEKLRRFRHHGIVRPENGAVEEEPWANRMQELGYNYRITDFQCALGIKQLEKLDYFLQRRQEIALEYQNAFAGLGLKLQKVESPSTRHAWHLFVVQLPLERMKQNRKSVFLQLQAEGIGVNVHYLPVHLQPYYQQHFSCKAGDFPKAEAYYQRALTLPLYPKMTQDQVMTVARSVRSAVNGKPAVQPTEAFSR